MSIKNILLSVFISKPMCVPNFLFLLLGFSCRSIKSKNHSGCGHISSNLVPSFNLLIAMVEIVSPSQAYVLVDS